MIPQTFEAWKHCIVNECKIDLTKEFALTRLAVYQNPENKETKVFAKLYGRQHLQNVIHWFQKI